GVFDTKYDTHRVTSSRRRDYQTGVAKAESACLPGGCRGDADCEKLCEEEKTCVAACPAPEGSAPGAKGVAPGAGSAPTAKPAESGAALGAAAAKPDAGAPGGTAPAPGPRETCVADCASK